MPNLLLVLFFVLFLFLWILIPILNMLLTLILLTFIITPFLLVFLSHQLRYSQYSIHTFPVPFLAVHCPGRPPLPLFLTSSFTSSRSFGSVYLSFEEVACLAMYAGEEEEVAGGEVNKFTNRDTRF